MKPICTVQFPILRVGSEC